VHKGFLLPLFLFFIVFTFTFSFLSSAGINLGGGSTEDNSVKIRAEERFVVSNVSELYTNSSDFWDDLDTPSDITEYPFWYNHTTETYNLYGMFWYNMTKTYFADEDWIIKNSTNAFEFNESKLTTVYYNATQTGIIKGIVDAGDLGDTHHQDGSYDGVSFNFSEESGSPALDLRINFTNIEDFNRGVMRYKTSNLAGDYPIIQMWSYNTNDWEDYPPVAESLSFATITQPVFDSTDHIGDTGGNDGIAQMRIYKASNGNTNNHYFVDWIAISKGYGTPDGEETDPYSWHRNTYGEIGNFTTSGNITAGGTICDSVGCISAGGGGENFWINGTEALYINENYNQRVNLTGNFSVADDIFFVHAEKGKVSLGNKSISNYLLNLFDPSSAFTSFYFNTNGDGGFRFFEAGTQIGTFLVSGATDTLTLTSIPVGSQVELKSQATQIHVGDQIGLGTLTPAKFVDIAGETRIKYTGTIKAVEDFLTLTNDAYAADSDGTGTAIFWRLTDRDSMVGTPTTRDAGRISVLMEQDWTETASTRDSAMVFSTSLDGSVTEKVRITSDGDLNALSNVRVGASTGETITMDGDDLFVLDDAEIGGDLSVSNITINTSIGDANTNAEIFFNGGAIYYVGSY